MELNPHNRNQMLYGDQYFNGLPVMQGKGLMIAEYLEALYRVTHQALNAYSRVSAFRFDLHFPQSRNADNEVVENSCMSRFIESMKAKIRHHRSIAKRGNAYAHDTDVRFVWAREVGEFGRVHYHVALLLNRDAYFTLGKFLSNEPNMAHRIREAWASALNVTWDSVVALVHFPENPVYHFGRGETSEVAAFFYRASYLCKVNTKMFGNGQHGFGASRN